MRFLVGWMRDPILNDMDVDSECRFTLHRQMLQKKKILREVFADFHHVFRELDSQFLSGQRTRSTWVGSLADA